MIQIIALLFALGTIVFLVTKKFPLYQAMLLGIFIIAITMGKPLADTLTLLWKGLSSRTTIELVLAVGLISLLSRLLKDFGFLENIMKSLVVFLHSAKLTMVLIPAIIGLFPIIGGAIVSAPLVDALGERLQISQIVKTSSNLIFRHAVFYFSPFNPSLILLSSITGIELLVILKYLFPLGIVNIAAGYFLYLHRTQDTGPLNPEHKAKEGSWSANLKALVFYGAPLIISLLLFLLFRFSLLFSLLIGVLTALLLGDKRGANFRDIFMKGPDPLLMLGIAGIMVFQSLIGEMEGLFGLVEAIAGSGVPNFVLFIAVPFLIGWISASFSITIGVAAPLLFPLLHAGESGVFYAVLLYASGFFSYFVSPIHLCQIVSNNYFNVRGFEAYKIQYPILLMAFITCLLIFGIGIRIV